MVQVLDNNLYVQIQATQIDLQSTIFLAKVIPRNTKMKSTKIQFFTIDINGGLENHEQIVTVESAEVGPLHAFQLQLSLS